MVRMVGNKDDGNTTLHSFESTFLPTLLNNVVIKLFFYTLAETNTHLIETKKDQNVTKILSHSMTCD